MKLTLRRSLLLLLTAAPLLAACGPPRQEVDCSQLLADEKYEQVVRKCDDPMDVGSAYLALAGFSFTRFLTADDPGNLVALLGLDSGNISLKRELINQAIRAVSPPKASDQAFVLLLGAFLGLGVTMEEYLDVGSGGAGALDNNITDDEVSAATGLVLNPDATIDVVTRAPLPYFQVIEAGTPYLTDCTDALPTTVLCDDASATSPINLALDPDGSARDVTTNPILAIEPQFSTVVGAFPAADPVYLTVMLTHMTLPVLIDPDKLARLESFLGQGTLDPAFPAQNPDLFPIGVIGYLDLLDQANAALIAATGADRSQTGQTESTLNDTIDEFRTRVDNGGACFDNADPASADPVEQQRAAVATLLDFLYNDLYLSAPGTVLNPAPEPADPTAPPFYTSHNVVANESLTVSGVTLAIDPTQFAFAPPGGIGYKFLYSTEAGLTTFDISKATPRIDQTYPQFQSDFEFIPRLVPATSQAGDGRVDIIEVLCFSSTP